MNVNRSLLSLLVMTIGVLAFMPNTAEAQRYSDPRSYYREFFSENRRIQMKHMRLMESQLRGDEERRVKRYRQMVGEQIQESLQAVRRLGGYQGDSTLRREYINALEMYNKAFNTTVSDSLSENPMQSYAKLEAYYTAVEESEGLAFDAAYKIEKAEDYFARQYNVDLRRDKEMLQQKDRMDKAMLHGRDVTLSFIRVYAKVEKILAYLEDVDYENDTLPDMMTELRKAIATSKEDVPQLMEFEEEALAEFLEDYLEDIEDELNKNLTPIAETLRNEYVAEDDYEDAKDDLEDFQEWHEEVMEDYKEEKNDLAEEFLPED